VFRIVAIEREFGCGGATIAQLLSERLGWKLYDQQMTEEIAKLAHVDPSAVMRCDERCDSRLYRLSKVFWRGSYERSLPLADSQAFDADRMVALVQQVVERAAKAGNCVIVGRGSPFFLRQRPDTFNVFLYAPRAEKVHRLQGIGKSTEEAENLIDEVDAERIAFVKHYFGADWPHRPLYHMMMNTAIGDEKVVTAILDTMNLLSQAKRAG